jgi:SAM-dependent methyltransferase
MRFFALTVPGLGELLRRELADQLAAGAAGPVEHDGRSDVVPFAAGPLDPLETRLAEDLFVELGTGDPAAPLPRLLARLWSADRYDAALAAIVPRLGRLGPRPGFRVVARMRAEHGFRRTELRDALTASVLRERPRWRPADPAAIELWALQTRAGRLRLGVRLSDRAMRQRSGREVERPGALRPAVAAAMLRLAVPPDGGPRVVLDPCCGSGTIVREALDAGWPAIGGDVARDAIAAGRANLPPGTPLLVADAAALPVRGGAAGAVVANLPFGRRHRLERPADWLPLALAEFERVVAPGGAIVLLAPPSPVFVRALGRLRESALRERHPLRLLGMPTTLWALRRARAR